MLLAAFGLALFYPQGYTSCAEENCARVSQTWAGIRYINFPLWLYEIWLGMTAILFLGGVFLLVRAIRSSLRRTESSEG
jgi:hypothetical protein